MKKTIKEIIKRSTMAIDGKMTGGFTSIRGGVGLPELGTNSSGCSNVGTCGSTNSSYCHNEYDCGKTTNNLKCDNDLACYY